MAYSRSVFSSMPSVDVGMAGKSLVASLGAAAWRGWLGVKAQWARHETVGSAPAQFRRHPHEPRAYVRYGTPGKPIAQWRHRTNDNAPTHPVTVPMDPCSTSSEPDGGISRSSMLHRCHPAECSTAPDRFPRLRQHSHRSVRHTRSDGRIRKSCQFVTVQPTNPRTRFLGYGRECVNRRTETADLGGTDMRRIGFPLALHTARIGHRDEHAIMRFCT